MRRVAGIRRYGYEEHVSLAINSGTKSVKEIMWDLKTRQGVSTLSNDYIATRFLKWVKMCYE